MMKENNEKDALLVNLGMNLKKLRTAKGLSQEELAHKSGLDRTYISGVERGIRNPSIISLQKVADALEVSLSLLMGNL